MDASFGLGEEKEMSQVEVSVVIPCLNEERTIVRCVEAARAALAALGEGFEVVVVDNGSADQSAALAAQAGARVIAHAVKGYGSALKRGFTEARGRYIVMADADCTYDFKDISKFYEKLQSGAEFVMGSRLRGKIEPGAMPWLHRYVGTPILTGLLNLFFGASISDTNCGMRGFRKQTILDLDLRCKGMEFASEMVVKAAKARLRMTEIPINYYRSLPGRVPNLHTFRDGWRHLKFMLLLAPRYLFILPGLLLVFLGLAGGLVVLFQEVKFFSIPLGLSSALFALALLFMGLQIMLFGLYTGILPEHKNADDGRLFQFIKKRFTLESGLVLGSLILLFGIVLGGVTIGWLWQSANSGSQINVWATKSSIVAIFSVLLGLQIIFSSFYMSLFNLSRTLE
jgi:glycosyltransferase involved in cell wall biosynthesis